MTTKLQTTHSAFEAELKVAPIHVEAPAFVNPSGLRALGHAVLVKPYEPEIKKSLLIIPDTVGDRTKMYETRATVYHVGSEAWVEERVPRAYPGDRVLISRFAGVLIRGTADGEFYRMVNDRDIFCQIESEEVSHG